MPLSDVREQFVKVSGRYDLVNTDDSDNGANWYINRGQRWLDLHKLSPVVSHRFMQNLEADTFYIVVPDCRFIEEVWVNDDETKVLLEQKTLKWIKEEYGDVTSSIDSGAPAYWAHAKPRTRAATGFTYTLPIIFEDSITDYSSLGTFLDLIFDEGDNVTKGGIIIAPPPSEEVSIDIVGAFFSLPLNEDADESWWSENYPDILVMAALRKLEGFYRNTAGVNDWNALITEELSQLDFAEVDKETINIKELAE